jgi:hypothetical protein
LIIYKDKTINFEWDSEDEVIEPENIEQVVEEPVEGYN